MSATFCFKNNRHVPNLKFLISSFMTSFEIKRSDTPKNWDSSCKVMTSLRSSKLTRFFPDFFSIRISSSFYYPPNTSSKEYPAFTYHLSSPWISKSASTNCLFFANSVASSSFISGGAWYVKESPDIYDIKYSETDMFRTYVVFEVDGGSNFTLYYKNNEVKALY